MHFNLSKPAEINIPTTTQYEITALLKIFQKYIFAMLFWKNYHVILEKFKS